MDDDFDDDFDDGGDIGDEPVDEFGDDDLDEPIDDFGDDVPEEMPEEEYPEDTPEEMPEEEYPEDTPEEMPEEEYLEDTPEEMPEEEYPEDTPEEMPEEAEVTEGEDAEEAEATEGQDIEEGEATEGEDTEEAEVTEGQDTEEGEETEGEDTEEAEATEGEDIEEGEATEGEDTEGEDTEEAEVTEGEDTEEAEVTEGEDSDSVADQVYAQEIYDQSGESDETSVRDLEDSDKNGDNQSGNAENIDMNSSDDADERVSDVNAEDIENKDDSPNNAISAEGMNDNGGNDTDMSSGATPPGGSPPSEGNTIAFTHVTSPLSETETGAKSKAKSSLWGVAGAAAKLGANAFKSPKEIPTHFENSVNLCAKLNKVFFPAGLKPGETESKFKSVARGFFGATEKYNDMITAVKKSTDAFGHNTSPSERLFVAAGMLRSQGGMEHVGELKAVGSAVNDISILFKNGLPKTPTAIRQSLTAVCDLGKQSAALSKARCEMLKNQYGSNLDVKQLKTPDRIAYKINGISESLKTYNEKMGEYKQAIANGKNVGMPDAKVGIKALSYCSKVDGFLSKVQDVDAIIKPDGKIGLVDYTMNNYVSWGSWGHSAMDFSRSHVTNLCSKMASWFSR